MAKSDKIMFPEKEVLAAFESMRQPNGAFVASLSPEYQAVWLRDQLYCARAYWDLEEYEKLNQSIWVVFDILQRYEKKIKARIGAPVIITTTSGRTFGEFLDLPGTVLQAKYSPSLEEITPDTGWGHDQLDALGLFLYLAADCDFKNRRIIRSERDLATLELVVHYLRSVEYWHHPDFGMWEECRIRHSSSIGAVLAGLKNTKKQKLAAVYDPLIDLGETALSAILPLESPDRCDRLHHRHDCDAAQLSLLWPYHIIVNPQEADQILSRIIEGHGAPENESHRLLQTHGFNRYWGDDYYRSTEGAYKGISAEWPLFHFWISIIYSQYQAYDKAARWFERGCREIVDGKIPEAYCNGRPNPNTPLAWAHALALIAFKKLPADVQKEFRKN